MVAWRVAKSLLVLRDQWKAAHPGAANPGFIGDAAHASRISDHNPWVDDPASTVNVVTAGDFYHQPQFGADAGKLAEALKAAKDPRVKYVIWNRRIWSLARDSDGWRPYTGENPHTGHCHVSVSSTKSRYDDTRRWVISTRPAPGDTPAPPPKEDEVDKAEVDNIVQGYALWARANELTIELALAKARNDTVAVKVLTPFAAKMDADWRAHAAKS